jgi:large subunit ribosomal protein L31e
VIKLSELERIYTIPLRKAWISQKYRRSKKAISLIKAFVERHMKPTEIIIDPMVNEHIWSRGIGNPPRKIRVRLSKDTDGVVTVTLPEAEE